MALTIETVPESIPLERVQDLVRSLGIDTKSLKSLSISRNAVEAEIYALNEDGKRYFVIGGDKHGEVAMHHIVIPVVHDDND